MQKVFLMLLFLACLVLIGCAKLTAAAKLGAINDRFKDRLLESGTADYDEYYALQKTAFPRWAKLIDQHGDPDYILPGFGSYCRMVWFQDKLVGSPTVFDTISSESGIPEEVIATRNRKNRVGNGEKVKMYEIESLTYVDAKKSGTLVVRVDDGDFSSARKWALSYIENLVKDKNVTLYTGENRKEALYTLRDERIDGKLMTILFEAL